MQVINNEGAHRAEGALHEGREKNLPKKNLRDDVKLTKLKLFRSTINSEDVKLQQTNNTIGNRTKIMNKMKN